MRGEPCGCSDLDYTPGACTRGHGDASNLKSEVSNLKPQISDFKSGAGSKPAPRRIRLLHVINSFTFGGAEAMLCSLLLRHDRSRFDLSVVSLIDDLSVAQPILDAGIPITVIGMRPGVPDPRGVARLAGHIRRLRPHVIQSWMDHSNFITAVANRCAGRTPLAWGIHHSEHLPGVAKRSTLLTVAACAKLSGRLTRKIVYCSEQSRRSYEKRGFAPMRGTVIPNGFDLSRFGPDAAARAAVRDEVGVPPDAPLVGLVARYDPFKDHATFFRAAALVARANPAAHFLLCGHKVDRDNRELAQLASDPALAGRCHLLGRRADVQRVYAALDVLASSSISEAFPLAVGEAMASGVPCAVTDVGDSSLLVGTTGKVVPPRDPAALAAAIETLLAMPPEQRQALGRAARARVEERFTLEAVTGRYEDLYEQLADAPRAKRSVPRSAGAPLPRGEAAYV
jgi:glycosyltransferase involved in cell wall biosynthesis